MRYESTHIRIHTSQIYLNWKLSPKLLIAFHPTLNFQTVQGGPTMDMQTKYRKHIGIFHDVAFIELGCRWRAYQTFLRNVIKHSRQVWQYVTECITCKIVQGAIYQITELTKFSENRIQFYPQMSIQILNWSAMSILNKETLSSFFEQHSHKSILAELKKKPPKVLRGGPRPNEAFCWGFFDISVSSYQKFDSKSFGR